MKNTFAHAGVLALMATSAGVLAPAPALAQSSLSCSDFGGVLDGFAGDVAPSSIEIDQNCTIRNFPDGMSTNFNFFTQPGQTDERWLIVFDNVVHTGNMSCNSVLEHKIWFTNGSSTKIQEGCQNLLIPVEKIEKDNPPGPATVTVGVPFTYTLTSPVLFDAGTGTVINNQGSLNDLHSVRLWDDLNETGVDLSYVSHTAYWLSDNTVIPLTFSDVGGLLTFDNFPIIPAGEQIVIEITVVLDDTPTNANGTQFINTARWEFGRLIEGVFYEPLPGEWGISDPLTISAPDLTLLKSGSQFLNLSETGSFVLDVQNVGGADAFTATLIDQLPHINGANGGGMCDLPPTITSAQVFQADGVTPVPGKGPLAFGVDYSVSWAGAPSCELSFTLLSAAGTIGAGERLIVTYDAALDADTSNGIVLTNIAGAVEWYNGDPGVSNRQAFTRTLTDGTPGTLDHEDAHTVTSSLFGSFFNKTVRNMSAGGVVATTAAPGDTLRYSLRLRTTASPMTDVRLLDDLGALNPVAVFEPGSLWIDPATLPPGASTLNTSPNGGTNGAGLLDIDSIDIAANSEILVEFEVRLNPVLPDGTLAINQSQMTAAGGVSDLSDDPAVNGQADPDIDGDEDPTVVQIVSAPVFDIDKISTYLDGDPTLLLRGERLRYTITVVNSGTEDASGVVLRDLVPADTTYIAGSTTLNGALVSDPAPGVSPLEAGIQIRSPADATPGSMPADPAGGAANTATIVFDVLVDADLADGTILSNQAFVDAVAFGITDLPSDDPRTPAIDDPTTDVVNSQMLGSYFNKTVVNVTAGGVPATTAAPGDTLRYTLTLRASDVPLTGVQLIDDLGALNALAVFEPGSLQVDAATLPAGADAQSTNPNGGTNNAGLLDIRNIDLAANTQLSVEFEVRLSPVIPDGTVVANQSQMSGAGGIAGISDDPNVNGEAVPEIDGDEDPTEVLIGSAPVFDIDKTSTYLDGDPARLMAGERLRYTITVVNIGSDTATDAFLRDQVPANTTYIADSTTLNGNPVADPSAGVSPLVAGIEINAPSDTTPGTMPADPGAAPANTATIVFDVLVDGGVADQTILSNQAFVDAVSAGVSDQPSDDPRTQVADDPTRDIVGNFPLIYAEKSAVLETDLSTPGFVDPGDTLRYTIRVFNNGPVDATDVVLTDQVPVNSIYVDDSTTLNGVSLGADGGILPLFAGLPISSSDLAPSLPGAGEGVLTPGEFAVIEFLVTVDAVAPGTQIVNQALVESAEFPQVLTDGDGNPATGPEPTIVVVGQSQLLSISKQVAVVGGGLALPGSTLEYTIRVTNIGSVPATLVTITDDLDQPVAGELQYVTGSATMNGSGAGVSFSGSQITADYGTEYGILDTADEIVLRFQATLDAGLATGTVVTNTADVAWNDTPETASASVSVTVGGVPGVGVLSGTVWHDANFDDLADTGERMLEGWSVTLYLGSTQFASATTDQAGNYLITGVAPTGVTPDLYRLEFRAPGAGLNTASLGEAASAFTNGPQSIADIPLGSGEVLVDLNLPIDPNGVVYNSVSRGVLAGAMLTMVDAGSGVALPSACFADEVQQGQVTLGDGFYKFDMDFSEPACPEGGAYLIEVTPPSTTFIAGPSQIIPPTSGPLTAALSVPSCLAGGAADSIPATIDYCEATISALAPATSVPAGSPGTVYHLHLILDNSNDPGSSQIFNNHIPLDPDLSDSVSISKTSSALSVTRGQLVPYVITVSNDAGFDLTEVNIVDRFPVGFRYVAGSARIDSVPTEPSVVGQELIWSNLQFAGAGQHRIDLLMAVGAGVSEGEFVNRAFVVHGVTGDLMSSEATATVRLVPDPDFDCTDVMGKVYDDYNRNGRQDLDEPGIAGIRLVATNGLTATTDNYGRYHITCAIVPNESRGSSFVLKLDDRTLPAGFRASNDTVQIARATRGKALRMNFSASIHRVIGLDLADPVFVAEGTELRPQWQTRLPLLLEQLEAAPAVLRLTYLADIEDPGLVRDRVDAIEREIDALWEEQGGSYELEIEPEIFWRRGDPPDERGLFRRRAR